MTYTEFLEHDELVIVHEGFHFTFLQKDENMTIIKVAMMGTNNRKGDPDLHHWHSALTIVTNIEAHAIYENLRNTTF